MARKPGGTKIGNLFRSLTKKAIGFSLSEPLPNESAGTAPSGNVQPAKSDGLLNTVKDFLTGVGKIGNDGVQVKPVLSPGVIVVVIVAVIGVIFFFKKKRR